MLSLKNKRNIPTNFNITKKIMLFTNAKDEGNIREWVAHHLLLGFDIVYIFDHKSNPPLKPTYFPKFDPRIIVERCELNNPVKFTLMARAVRLGLYHKADWILYLDADEFLSLNNFKGVKQMLHRYHGADSLSINWLMFGSNHHVKEPSGLITENYTKSDRMVCNHVKTFVRPSQVRHVNNPHFFNIYRPQRMWTIDKKIMRRNNAFNDCNLEYNKIPAFIAHYVYQSEETFMRRKVNNGMNDDGTTTQNNRDLFATIHTRYNEVENKYLKDAYSERIKLFLLKI